MIHNVYMCEASCQSIGLSVSLLLRDHPMGSVETCLGKGDQK